ncbi:MAG: hypothetical protein ACP5E2_14615 [Terracidiphilus sp.]
MKRKALIVLLWGVAALLYANASRQEKLCSSCDAWIQGILLPPHAGKAAK